MHRKPAECHQCIWLYDHDPEGPTCMAFPDGIPEDIWEGLSKHHKKVKGQKGDFVYKPQPGETE